MRLHVTMKKGSYPLCKTCVAEVGEEPESIGGGTGGGMVSGGSCPTKYKAWGHSPTVMTVTWQAPFIRYHILTN